MILIRHKNSIYNIDNVNEITVNPLGKVLLLFADKEKSLLDCSLEEFERAVISAAKMVQPKIVEVKTDERV